MTSRNDQNIDESIIRRAMLELKWVIPTTPEEVELAESHLNADLPQLPPELANPLDVLERTSSPSAQCSHPLVPPNDTTVQENLARAAREGGKIPADVQERMKQDRDDAERNSDEQQHK